MSDSGFSKKYVSINKNRDFQFLFKRGKSVVNNAFVCYYKESRRRVNRCGIMTSKKIGNAVVRNRSRRVIREAFRYVEPYFRERCDKRYDFIFVARASTHALKSTKIAPLIKSRVFDQIIGKK